MWKHSGSKARSFKYFRDIETPGLPERPNMWEPPPPTGGGEGVNVFAGVFFFAAVCKNFQGEKRTIKCSLMSQSLEFKQG